MEQNLKDVYTITISNTKNNGLSKAEIKTLQAIAKQCPYEGGYGVYNARVLLSVIDNTAYNNSCENGRSAKSGLKLASEGSGEFNATTVYPNPANNKLNVALQLEAGQTGVLMVYDLTGKLALTAALTESANTEISTVLLSEGLYIYKIEINNSLVSTGKLSIVR